MQTCIHHQEGNGSDVRLFITYIDAYAGGFDAVGGTLTTFFDLYHATTFLTIATPVATMFSPLASNIT